MKKSFLSICLFAVYAFFAGAQTSVVPFDANSDLLNGIVYSLPKTELNIAVSATCTVRKAGPFYQYAERYLASDKVIVTDSHKWEIDDITIEPIAVPDANRCYMVGYDARGIANNISFYEGNIIAGVNCECDFDPQVAPSDKSEAPVSIEFDYGCLGEEALVSTSIPKMAEMAARQIYRIRESRMALISAEVDNVPDGKAVRVMLNRLEKEESELVALFLGKTASYSVTKVFSVDPDDDISNLIIARISTAEGIVNAKNVIGAPIYLSVKGKYLTAPNIDPRIEKMPKGFYYNVPGEAMVSVSFDTFVKNSSVVMPQFGYAVFLNSNVTNNNKSKISFNPKYGTINSIAK